MPKFVVAAIVLFGSGLALAQSPQELLRATAKQYQSVDSFNFEGKLSTPIQRTGWSFECDAADAAASSRFLSPDVPWPALYEAFQVGQNGHLVRARATPKHPTPKNIPYMLPTFFGHYGDIIKDLQNATRAGIENVRVDGRLISCELIDAHYRSVSTRGHISERDVRYCIDPAHHLVLKHTFQENSIQWTYTVERIALNQAPPQWLLESAQGQIGKTRVEWVGKPAPEFMLPDMHGNERSLTALKGKAVLLDFWGTYCGPCREEMHMIEELSRDYGPRGFVALGVTDDNPDVVEKWMQQFRRTLPTLIDVNREVFRKFDIQSIPVAVLIAPDGSIVQYWQGMQRESDLRSGIEKALSPMATANR